MARGNDDGGILLCCSLKNINYENTEVTLKKLDDGLGNVSCAAVLTRTGPGLSSEKIQHCLRQLPPDEFRSAADTYDYDQEILIVMRGG